MPPQGRHFCLCGGEGGIRTLDTLLTYTPLAGERLQPLGHFSRFCLLRFFLISLLHSPVAHYSVLCTSPFGSPSCLRRSFAVLDCSVSHSATSPNSIYFASFNLSRGAPRSRVTRCCAPRPPGRRRAAGAPSQSWTARSATRPLIQIFRHPARQHCR